MNDTCKSVAEHMRTKLGKTDDYEVGEYLICREYTKLKEGTLNVNFKLEITEVHEDELVIQDKSINIKNISCPPLAYSIKFHSCLLFYMS